MSIRNELRNAALEGNDPIKDLSKEAYTVILSYKDSFDFLFDLVKLDEGGEVLGANDVDLRLYFLLVAEALVTAQL